VTSSIPGKSVPLPYLYCAPPTLKHAGASRVSPLLRLSIRYVLLLIMVICLYLTELRLSYYPAPVRFSFGWYTIRIIGFLPSSLVLIVLLHEV
jgi:hypothetical protein